MRGKSGNCAFHAAKGPSKRNLNARRPEQTQGERILNGRLLLCKCSLCNSCRSSNNKGDPWSIHSRLLYTHTFCRVYFQLLSFIMKQFSEHFRAEQVSLRVLSYNASTLRRNCKGMIKVLRMMTAVLLAVGTEES